MVVEDNLSPTEAFIQRLGCLRYKRFAVIVVMILLLLVAWQANDIALPNALADPLTYLRITGSKDQIEERGPLIPRKIWQVMLHKESDIEESVIDPEALRDTASWLAMNPDYA
jgi:alpha 1,6-mannosyltransferase